MENWKRYLKESASEQDILTLQADEAIDRVRKAVAHDAVIKHMTLDDRKDLARTELEFALKRAIESMYRKQVNFQHDKIPWEKIHQTESDIKYSEDWKSFVDEFWQIGVFHAMAKKGKLPGRLNDMAISSPEDLLHAYELASTMMLLPEEH